MVEPAQIETTTGWDSQAKPRWWHKSIFGKRDTVQADRQKDLEKAADGAKDDSRSIDEGPVEMNGEKPAPAPDQPSRQVQRTTWQKFVDEFRKNYCPRTSPPLILPTCPTDDEKYSFVDMNRLPIILCGLVSTLSLSVGAWLFVHANWYFFWYAVYALYSESYLFASVFVSVWGKSFDLPAHNKKKEKFLLTDETAPTVDIFLPVCKEPLEVLENTWKHVAQLKYPAGKCRPIVLDDGAQEGVMLLAKRFGYRYLVRPDRPVLKKAGNMRHAFSVTDGQFFVVFDADFCPRPDFLLELMPIHLDNPNIAIVQSPQFFRSPDEQTWIEQGSSAVQEHFYRLIQTCRNTWGASICVGSNAVYRRASLTAVGGTAPAECSEDVHTGFYAVDRGWSLFYTPLVLACGICPSTPRALFSQQMRWCTGSLSLLTRRDFWRSKLNRKQKACYLTGMMYYSTTATALVFSPLPAPILLWTRPDLMKYYNLFFALPSLLTGLVFIRCWARSRYTQSVQYAQIVMAYAYLHAFWDHFCGTKLVWVPSGDNKAHKNNRYRNMLIFAWAWTITHNTLLITGATYRICTGLAWYQVVPALCLDLYNLLVVHRSSNPAIPPSHPNPSLLSSNAPLPHSQRVRSQSPKNKQFWLDHGFLKIPSCSSREAATQFTAALWGRVGASPHDKSTWPTGKVNMPSHNAYPVKAFAPKAWAAICEVLGGEDKIAEWCTNWKDSYIPDWGEPGFHADDELNYRRLANWHADGESFVHYLNSPEQALLVNPLFTDIAPKGGGTEPKLTRPYTFHEAIGNVGDVYVLHPFMLHSASKNPRRHLRIITNPPVAIKAPFRYWREDGRYSLGEKKTLRELRKPEGFERVQQAREEKEEERVKAAAAR
ncbi:glycosyltransferase family 2 protein [Teratosphaeria destructans]|uniref:Glycosyltransferase family 2 protein n=1 Tax=Teratosphaeria destructans TaxID=418781 RepID=A0A9W7T1B0_9PEZI|nr:glycosyltransferase family 2 protein [Teratosphaeria destructans]